MLLSGETLGNHLISNGIGSFDKFEKHIKNVEDDFWNMSKGYTTSNKKPCIGEDFQILHADREGKKTVIIVEVNILAWNEFVHILDTSGNGLYNIKKIN